MGYAYLDLALETKEFELQQKRDQYDTVDYVLAVAMYAIMGIITTLSENYDAPETVQPSHHPFLETTRPCHKSKREFE